MEWARKQYFLSHMHYICVQLYQTSIAILLHEISSALYILARHSPAVCPLVSLLALFSVDVRAKTGEKSIGMASAFVGYLCE